MAKKTNTKKTVAPVTKFIPVKDKILAIEMGLAYLENEFVTMRDLTRTFNCSMRRTHKLLRETLYDVHKGLAEIVERKAVSKRPLVLPLSPLDINAFHRIPADKATLRSARALLASLKEETKPKPKPANTTATKVGVRKKATATKTETPKKTPKK